MNQGVGRAITGDCGSGRSTCSLTVMYILCWLGMHSRLWMYAGTVLFLLLPLLDTSNTRNSSIY